MSKGSHRVSKQKLLDGGGAKSSYGPIPHGGKMRKVSSGEAYSEDQGKVRGATKHTYGVKD